MKDMEDLKENKESLKQESTSKSEGGSLCNALLASEKKVENAEMFTTELIEKTPYIVAGSEKKGYFATLGEYRVSEPYPDKKTVIKKVYKKDWEILINTIAVIIEKLTKNGN